MKKKIPAIIQTVLLILIIVSISLNTYNRHLQTQAYVEYKDALNKLPDEVLDIFQKKYWMVNKEYYPIVGVDQRIIDEMNSVDSVAALKDTITQ